MENNPSAAGMDKKAPLLITGASGFLGRNLAATLRAAGWCNLLLLDVQSPPNALEEYAAGAAFVFHLAGVNRPKSTGEFHLGNTLATQRLLAALRGAKNAAPVLFTSTAQVGNGSEYAQSKAEAETAIFTHGKENGSPVFVYRLPGVFGKWSRPNYNTVVATFCHNIARGLPIEVRDAALALQLCYVDDVMAAFLANMNTWAEKGTAALPPAGGMAFLGIDPTYELTLGWLAGAIHSFASTRATLGLPDVGDALTAKLWATYQSFIPPDALEYPLTTHADARGSFTEFTRTHAHGQISVNMAKSGVVKGNHWHNTKNEKFLVVRGRALIRVRPIGSADTSVYRVCGEKLCVVDIPPGAAHNIENVGDEDLVTVMWASEVFDPERPDTFYEEV